MLMRSSGLELLSCAMSMYGHLFDIVIDTVEHGPLINDHRGQVAKEISQFGNARSDGIDLCDSGFCGHMAGGRGCCLCLHTSSRARRSEGVLSNLIKGIQAAGAQLAYQLQVVFHGMNLAMRGVITGSSMQVRLANLEAFELCDR